MKQQSDLTNEADKVLACNAPLKQAWGEIVKPPTAAMRRTADAAVDGVVFFYEKPTQVGRTSIDWSAPHHDHQEWPAQLNRFYWLEPLAALYRESNDEKYAEAARDYIADWMRAHPARADWEKAPRDSVLNLCIRIGNSQWAGWTGCLENFMKSAAFDASFVEAVVASCGNQLDYLQANISGGSNWRIANADALAVHGIRLNFLPGAERWREAGVRIINDAWHRQVLADGVHIERNPGYHCWMTRVMSAYAKLKRELPELGLVMDAAQIGKMYNYALGSTRPNGSLNAIHDCLGERSGIHENPLREERVQFLREAGLSATLPPASQFFPNAGQALLRDSWNSDATYLTFDASQWGGGHCHLSRNSVQLHASGRSLLVDPGTFTYERSDPFCAYGKSTRAHNTLNLNGWNQDIVNPQDTRAHHGSGYDFVASEYRGAYWSKPYHWKFAEGRGTALYGTHSRILLWLHGRAAIVIDSFYREAETLPEAENDMPSLEINWQLCEGGDVAIEDEGRVVARYSESNLLMLFPLRSPELKLSLHEGEEEPLRGWLPATHTEIVPAPQLSLGCERMRGLHAEVVTVLVPFTGTDAPRVQAVARPIEGRQPASLILRWENGETDELWWTDRLDTMLNKVAGVETDGGMIHLQKDSGGRVLTGCAVEATYFLPHAAEVKPEPELILF